VKAPACSRVKALGKLDDKFWLSAHEHCNQHAAFLSTNADVDNARIADWQMRPVEGKKNTYNIIVSAKRGERQNDCNRKFLSVGAGCGQTYVDLWSQDDKSGRQQWTIRKVEGQEDAYTFTVGGRDNCPRVYLSTRDRWDRVDLWNARNNNNQWFGIEEGVCQWPIADQLELPTCNKVQSLGKRDGKTLLTSYTTNCNNGNWLINPNQIEDNNMFTEKWNFIPVEGKRNVYNIVATDERKCDRRYLSVGLNCGQTYVDLWFRDEKNGAQQWEITKIGDNKFTLLNHRNGRCPRNTLSTRYNWDRTDLWTHAQD
jgi:hypothetical protein